MKKQTVVLWALAWAGLAGVTWLSFQAAGQKAGSIDQRVTKSKEPLATEHVTPLPGQDFMKQVEASEIQTPPPQTVNEIQIYLDDLATTYNPAELQRIKPYLLHPEAEVRAAALNAMMVLGDGAASPLLREAAGQLANPREATAYLEAADHLELPSASMRNHKKFKSQEKAAGKRQAEVK